MKGVRTTRDCVPSGWVEVTLGDCLNVLRGVSYSKNQSGAEPRDGSIPILRANNIGDNLNFNDLVYVDECCISDAQLLRIGDIVVAASSGSIKVVGKAAPLLVPWHGAFGAFCYALRVHPKLSAQYIAAFLQTEEYRHQASERAKGTNINNLRREHITSVRIPLPPLAEQARIADRIDELFTDLAAGVAALERVKRNLSRYRAAVLHAAVTGRLTEAWRKEHGPPDEPAPELLERILVERRKQWERRTLAAYKAKGKQPPKNWKSRYKEPAPPKPQHNGKPLPMLPEGWCSANHDQVGDVQLGRQRSPQHHQGDHMRPYLRVANVYEDRIDTTDILEMNFTPDEFRTYELKYGDILLNEGQSMELVGRPAMYRDELPGGCFQNTLVRQRVFDGVIPEYAFLVCRAQFRAGRFRQIASITTSIAHLGAQRFAALEFPLPPLTEQSAIIEAVNEKLSQIDALEAEVTRGLARAGRLRQAILKAAFEGKLVPQDPSDEPASVLLERIREQAADAPKPKRKTHKKKVANV